ncbi:hypothetical protein TRAPUB_8007 [Trametes pubescens]|uniref:Uncharacterized protein n=1 Tax=Trametes pubescens TaxID=154538 RepID=A0A1M2W6F1_TRAPU|nr:hypothetical protein TRAPUB_8007 [Trametes pubescens]
MLQFHARTTVISGAKAYTDVDATNVGRRQQEETLVREPRTFPRMIDRDYAEGEGNVDGGAMSL